jgi:hypothetical protein
VISFSAAIAVTARPRFRLSALGSTYSDERFRSER